MMSVFKRKQSCHQRSGFTLIELLIVMVILGISSALVGPSLFQQYTKMQQQQELVAFKQQLRFIGQQAFYSRSAIQLSLDGKKVSLHYLSSTKLIKEREYKGLFFDPVILVFNRDGNTTLTELNVTIDGKEYDVQIPQILERKRVNTD